MARFYPGYSQDGQTSQALVGVDYRDPETMGGLVSLPGGVGQIINRGPFLVAGFNSFMLTADITTGSTIRINYIHIDPASAATVISVFVVDVAVSAVPVRVTWGAFAAIGPADTFIKVTVQFENRGAGAATWVNPRLWSSAR